MTVALLVTNVRVEVIIKFLSDVVVGAMVALDLVVPASYVAELLSSVKASISTGVMPALEFRMSKPIEEFSC